MKDEVHTPERLMEIRQQQADASWVEGLVRKAAEIIGSALAHVSHGGPTRAEAEAWLHQAETWLKESENEH